MVAFRSKPQRGGRWSRALALLLACAVLHAPASALADGEPTTVVDPTADTVEVGPTAGESGGSAFDTGAKIIDAVFVRPFAFLAVGVGAFMLVPAAILSAADGKEARQKAVDVFVLNPWDDATRRGLGE